MLEQIDLLMDSYYEFVNEGVSLNPDNPRERLLLAVVGLAGETGEVIDLVKKHVFHRKSEGETRPKIVEELGDVLWYYTLLMKTYDISWDEVIATNITKLTARYPERHSE